MTITLGKKQLTIIVIAIIIICLALFGIKSYNRKNYENCAKEMKLNSNVAVQLAAEILNDYQDNWQSAINDDKATNIKGESDYCSDFNTALEWRYIYYNNKGYFKALDSLSNIAKKNMENMVDAPKKYEDTQKSLTTLYNDMHSLISLTESPTGSILTFGSKVNDLMMEIEAKNNETDLKINVSKDSIKRRTISIITSIEASIYKKKLEFAKQMKKRSNKNKAEYRKKGFKDLGNGILYKIIKKGKGPIPKETSMVKVNYEGRTIDGKVFDSSYKRGQPVELRANQVIKGWTYALTHMKEGSIWEIFIPYNLAYGDTEQGDIKPYSDLIFKIDLLSVTKE